MDRIKRVKYIIIAMMLAAAVMPSFIWADAKVPEVEGTSVIMIDRASGQILYEKNAVEKRDPASITKILTCLVVLENLELDRVVTVPEDSSPIGVNIDMHKGEKLTVEQLLYAMMLPSANDAARVLAIETAGDIDSFCDMMNERAKECGAKNTHFTNTNGLNTAGQEHHRTTAEDLALIAGEALDNKTFRKLVTTVRYTIPPTNKSEARKLKTTNPLLKSGKKVEVDGVKIPLEYERATGIKTGTTSTAGNCFAASAKDGDTEFIVITLDSGEYTRFTDAVQLFEYGFENFGTQILAREKKEIQSLKVRRGASGHVPAGAADTLAVTCSRNSDGSIEEADIEVKLIPAEDKVDAPVCKGDVVGTVQLVDGSGKVHKSCDAIALENVDRGGPLSAIGIPDDMVPLFAAAVVTAALIVLITLILIRQRKAARETETKRSETAPKDV